MAEMNTKMSFALRIQFYIYIYIYISVCVYIYIHLKNWTLCPFKQKLKLKGTCCNKKKYKNVCISSEKVCNKSSQKQYTEYYLLPRAEMTVCHITPLR